ncbi:PilZ domain-containing protein [Psychromonas sp.]|nr:PilZ domain-containing protein [Psychromonas sp.]
MSERRKFSRVNFQGSCSLIFDKPKEHHDFEALLVDISLDGALISIQPIVVDLEEELVQLHLTLEGSDIELVLNGFVCHQQEALLGVQFTKLSIETITHLKRLIELNLGDTKSMNREFSELIEQHIANVNT